MNPHRKSLNDNQLNILLLIYKFRFVSITLITEHRQVNVSATTRSFSTLLDQGYIAKRYNKAYKLLGKPASYCLTTKSTKLLREAYGLNEAMLHAQYKNKSVSDSFVEQCIAIYQAYLNIEKLYPNTFDIYTKAELADFDYYPDTAPNLYLSRIAPAHNIPDDYMLDICTDVQTFIIKKRVNQYIEHFDSGDWTQDIYPTVLIVCASLRVEKVIQEYIERARDNAFIEDEDLPFMTASEKDMFDSRGSDIWRKVCDGDCLLGL